MTDSVFVVDVEYTVVLRVVDAACCEVTYNTAVTVLATVLNAIDAQQALVDCAVNSTLSTTDTTTNLSITHNLASRSCSRAYRATELNLAIVVVTSNLAVVGR